MPRNRPAMRRAVPESQRCVTTLVCNVIVVVAVEITNHLHVGIKASHSLHGTVTGGTVAAPEHIVAAPTSSGRLQPPVQSQISISRLALKSTAAISSDTVERQADPADASRQAALSKTDSPLVELAVPQPAVPAVTRI